MRRACAALLAGVVVGATPVAAEAQDGPAPMTSEAAIALLPDPERFDLAVEGEGLEPGAAQDIGQGIIDALGGSHFYGAAYAFLPDGSTELSLHVRSGHHSLDAAEEAALADCEAAGGDATSRCRAIARIVPAAGQAAEGPSLSHDAAYGLRGSAERMGGPVALARSRATPAWAMWSGQGATRSALDECAEKVRAEGFEPDCEIVVEDPGTAGASGTRRP